MKTVRLNFLFVNTLLSLLGNSGCLTWVRLQEPQKQSCPVLQVHAGSFCVSVFHQTPLTWTTGSLTCIIICYHSYVCAYTWGLGTLTTSQHNIFDSVEKLSQIVLVLLTGFEPWVFGSQVRCSTS